MELGRGREKVVIQLIICLQDQSDRVQILDVRDIIIRKATLSMNCFGSVEINLANTGQGGDCRAFG